MFKLGGGTSSTDAPTRGGNLSHYSRPRSSTDRHHNKLKFLQQGQGQGQGQGQRKKRRRRQGYSSDHQLLILLILVFMTQLNQFIMWNLQGPLSAAIHNRRSHYNTSITNITNNKSIGSKAVSSSSLRSFSLRRPSFSKVKYNDTKKNISDKNNNIPSTTIYSNNINSNNYTYNVFVHVRAFGEGISAWRFSVAQLLAFAQAGNATLVEPCIKDGRLGSCENRSREQKVPISQIFDLSKAFVPTTTIDSIVTSPPLMIPYEQFLLQTTTNPTTKQSVSKTTVATMNNIATKFIKTKKKEVAPADEEESTIRTKMCLTPFKKQCYAINYFEVPDAQEFFQHQSNVWWSEKIAGEQPSSKKGGGGGKGTIRKGGTNSSSTPLLQPLKKKNRTAPVILDILQYWRNGFCLAKNETINQIYNEFLNFHPNQVAKVDKWLAQANIVGNHDKNQEFSVIHWRAEKEGMDYMNCAKAIVDARDQMMMMTNNSYKKQQQKFLLMTSLNINPQVMWEGSRNITYAINNQSAVDARTALQYLLNQEGFIKIDDLVKNNGSSEEDSGMLAIWDLILASKAQYFSTCSRRDPDGTAATDDANVFTDDNTDMRSNTLSSLSASSVCAYPHSQQICEQCNHIGKFAKLAVKFRKQIGKQSYECWPQN